MHNLPFIFFSTLQAIKQHSNIKYLDVIIDANFPVIPWPLSFWERCTPEAQIQTKIVAKIGENEHFRPKTRNP